ncbi:MAG TPA: hypothetical protein ENJ50_06750 [Planctomycetaceae bacterium]|nr:hypothetical protein [Planctomycetaceae bacterium]
MKSSTYPPLELRCEWNPRLGILAREHPRFGDCRGIAKVRLVIKGETIDLCENCVFLPEFANVKTRTRIRRRRIKPEDHDG